MAGIILTQADADDLLRMPKKCVDLNTSYNFPAPGHKLVVPLLSHDEHEHFSLDIGRHSLVVTSKVSYQHRARHNVILARLDIDGNPHRNPDGAELPCPHLHLYRENYADKWAFPVPPDAFSNLGDLQTVLNEFMAFGTVTIPPKIHLSLWT